MGLNLVYSDGQTPIDEDEKQGLKIRSISTQQELNELEQLNIEKAVEWVMRSKLTREKILTEKFICDLHSKMYGDVWKWAGSFRKSEKNIGIKWMMIAVELRQLINDANFWIDNQTFPPEEIAIRFKHRIVSIHCFPNGNGRHSRLLADIIIESVFRQGIFGWHGSNMVNPDKVRAKYIDALRKADNGEFQLLIDFAGT